MMTDLFVKNINTNCNYENSFLSVNLQSNKCYVSYKNTIRFSDKNFSAVAPGDVQRMPFHFADAIHLEIRGRYGG